MQLSKFNLSLLQLIASFYTKLSNLYLTYNSFSKVISLNEFPSFRPKAKIGIIIQGQVVTENDFTLNTIKLYSKLYPDIPIILSSWKGIDKKFLFELTKMRNVKYVLSNVPTNPGIKNVNLQILSTKIGIDYLERMNCEYMLKTRTDQRLETDIDFLTFFCNLQKEFPIENSSKRKKLIISSLNTYRRRLYGVSDMLIFGATPDFRNYINAKFDTKEETDIKIESDDKNFMRQGTAEGYLILNFMKNIGHSPSWTKEDHKFFMKENFVVVNHSEIGHFWFKNNWSVRSISTKANPYLTFSDWLNMKNEISNN